MVVCRLAHQFSDNQGILVLASPAGLKNIAFWLSLLALPRAKYHCWRSVLGIRPSPPRPPIGGVVSVGRGGRCRRRSAPFRVGCSRHSPHAAIAALALTAIASSARESGNGLRPHFLIGLRTDLRYRGLFIFSACCGAVALAADKNETFPRYRAVPEGRGILRHPRSLSRAASRDVFDITFYYRLAH